MSLIEDSSDPNYNNFHMCKNIIYLLSIYLSAKSAKFAWYLNIMKFNIWQIDTKNSKLKCLLNNYWPESVICHNGERLEWKAKTYSTLERDSCPIVEF